jgi:hypothetical protein
MLQISYGFNRHYCLKQKKETNKHAQIQRKLECKWFKYERK